MGPRGPTNAHVSGWSDVLDPPMARCVMARDNERTSLEGCGSCSQTPRPRGHRSAQSPMGRGFPDSLLETPCRPGQPAIRLERQRWADNCDIERSPWPSFRCSDAGTHAVLRRRFLIDETPPLLETRSLGPSAGACAFLRASRRLMHGCFCFVVAALAIFCPLHVP